MRGVFKKRNKWYIDYTVNGRRRKEVIGPCKKTAEAVLHKRLTDIAENKHLEIEEEKKTKFKDFAAKYMETHSRPFKRSWKSSDLNSLKQLIPFFGDKYLYEITPVMVIKFRNQRAEKVRRSTVNRDLSCLRAMFNKAIDWDDAKVNPLNKVEFYKENNTRTRYLEREEIAKLLSNCSPKLKAVVTLAVHTGMRKGEIQDLKWSQVHFRMAHITLLKTKSGEKRIIPLNRAARQALMSVPKHAESPVVFCDKAGKPYNFRKSFETALRKSGILGFRFHDLRHTFASHLVMRGVDLNTVRELLGHKSLDMTLRYSHLSRDHKRRAVEVLESRHVPATSPGYKSVNSDDFDKVVSSLKIAS